MSMRIEVRLVKGPTGKGGDQRRVLTAMGLRKWGHSVIVTDSPSIRGMVQKVLHLVEVRPAPGGKA